MSDVLSLTGALTALVSPFNDAGDALDLDAFEAHVERQIAGGVTGLVPCGTTGETPTLSDGEQRTLIERAVAVARGRVPVIAGTGTFSTQKTVEASRRAVEAGADAVMVVMPYYSKPTQEGLFQHLVTVAKAAGAPVVLYNVPGRCQVELTVETTARVCDVAPNVVALKDATGNVLRCQELVARLGGRLAVLCGDDVLTVPMMAAGATGVISVTSNLYPDRVSEVASLAASGRFAEARARHLALLDVHAAMFIESNPACVKAALASKGLMSAALRLPLTAASAPARARVAEAVARYESRP